MIAYSGSTWTQIIVAISIFVPVVVTIVLAFFFLRSAKNDPDERRLKQAQADYEARQADRANRRR